MTIESDLEIIADKIAQYAKGEDVIFKDRLDSFRALSSYYFNKGKKPSKDDPEEQGDNFDDFRQRVSSATSGNGEDNPP